MKSRYTDYIPTKDGDFLILVKKLFAGVSEHAAAWGIDPMTWSAIILLIATYETALEKAKDDNHGRADVLAKNKARDVLKKPVRQYVKEHLIANSAISDDDRKRINCTGSEKYPSLFPKFTTGFRCVFISDYEFVLRFFEKIAIIMFFVFTNFFVRI
ncbi:MAG: hypothetical protein LBE04_01110 [Prevotellaceae bacterium]|jgi:hypothetical protein|nr:hypothetical protein [Prevotellaceae bacterium]